MKICIPVSSPDGLSSPVESILSQAKYLHIFDLEERTFEEIDVSALVSGSAPATEFDVVVCASINRAVFQAFRQQGKKVYLTESPTVEQAVEEFERGEMFLIPDVASGCGGGGCHGHGVHEHEHGQGGCQCQSSNSGEGHCHGEGGEGGGCSGHGDEGHGGCCSSRNRAGAPVRKARGDMVRIAVTSQNRKTITEHAGKCRKFWIYETRSGGVIGKSLLELPPEQTLHSSSPRGAHPLDDIDVLITSGIGDGLRQRLASMGIATIVTSDTDPDLMVMTVLASM